MLRAKILILSLCILTTAGCGQMPSQAVTRNTADLLAFEDNGHDSDALMVEQAQALDAMTRDLVRAATLKGAAVGAAAGCGLAIVSSSESAKCLAGAVAGGAVGAAVGNAVGHNQVAQRVEVVQLSRVTPAISGAAQQMARMNDGMTEFLSGQDDELALMKMLHDKGTMSQQDYDARLAAIRASRADVAEALTLSAAQAQTAKQALAQAKAQGQTGLDWHIMQVDTLEDEATSARSRISLL